MSSVPDFRALLYGDDPARWSKGFDLATPAIVTYSFTAQADLPGIQNYNPYNATSYKVFTETQEANFRLAANMFDGTAGLIFLEVDGPAMINLFGSEGADFDGWATYASSSRYHVNQSGKLVINGSNDTNPLTYPSSLMLHELGHTMGLKHPHDGDPTLVEEFDNDAFTVMSYNYAPRDETALPPLDADALRYLYGDSFATKPSLDYDPITDIVSIFGGDGDDTLLGVNKASRIEGGAGDDLLAGRQANDTLIAGTGSDTVFGGNGDDTLVLPGLVEDYLIDLSSYDDNQSGVLVARRFTDEIISIEGIENVIVGGSNYIFNTLFGAPDLSISSAYYPSSLTDGIASRSGVWVYNKGTKAAADVLVTAYLSADGELDVSDQAIGSAVVDSLAVNASQHLNIDLTPVGASLEDHMLIYAVDPLDAVAESNEDNNTTAPTTIEVEEPQADLTVSLSYAPGTITNGVTSSSGVWVYNYGTLAAADVLVTAYLSADGNLDVSDQAIGSAVVDSLAVNASQYLNIDLTPVGASLKDHMLIYAVDPLDAVAESNEGNNITGASIIEVRDRPIATAGRDRIKGTNQSDSIDGLGGNDDMRGLNGDDSLRGGAGADTVLGNAGNDRLWGANGDDSLEGGSGRDRVIGNAGSDMLKGGDGNDTVIGGGGHDRMWGGSGSDQMKGGGGNDRLIGGGGNDRLIGGGGNDRLVGGGGDDRLVGNAGRDTLIGGKGDDTLIGGGGPDRFVFGPRQGVDLVKDYRDGQDKIVINGVDDFAALSIFERGGDAVITFRGTSIRLDGADTNDIDETDFLF